MGISIFIQTLNEEDNLPGLIESVRWSDDIVVLDSLSTDRTKEIAEAHGCRWFSREYDGRGPHQNWAMKNIDFKYPWVFYLDADERMTPELRVEIEKIASNREEQKVAYFCGRKNYLLGKWIKHAFPPWNIMRFFKPKHVSFARLSNPTVEIDGEFGYLEEMFIHYNFSKGFHEWFERHNRYSTYEAIETVKAFKECPIIWKDLVCRDSSVRRKEQKNLSMRLPARAVFKFLYLYIFQRGFLDGAPGFNYCILQMIYEYLIVIKVKELKYRKNRMQK